LLACKAVLDVLLNGPLVKSERVATTVNHADRALKRLEVRTRACTYACAYAHTHTYIRMHSRTPKGFAQSVAARRRRAGARTPAGNHTAPHVTLYMSHQPHITPHPHALIRTGHPAIPGQHARLGGARATRRCGGREFERKKGNAGEHLIAV
jgi:hypothetical protein